jgi:hypothetical protein
MSDVDAARQRQQQHCRQGHDYLDTNADDLMDANDDIVLIGELDASWRDDCARLARRLHGWKAQLDELGDVPDDNRPKVDDDTPTHSAEDEPSSLSRLLDACGGLVDDMLAELRLMECIERDALARETEWIRRMNEHDDGGRDELPRAGAIWRAI